CSISKRTWSKNFSRYWSRTLDESPDRATLALAAFISRGVVARIAGERTGNLAGAGGGCPHDREQLHCVRCRREIRRVSCRHHAGADPVQFHGRHGARNRRRILIGLRRRAELAFSYLIPLA